MNGSQRPFDSICVWPQGTYKTIVNLLSAVCSPSHTIPFHTARNYILSILPMIIVRLNCNVFTALDTICIRNNLPDHFENNHLQSLYMSVLCVQKCTFKRYYITSHKDSDYMLSMDMNQNVLDKQLPAMRTWTHDTVIKTNWKSNRVEK